jgi:hypothetical protein
VNGTTSTAGGDSDLPRATRIALWALLSVSLLILLILVEYQRQRTELALSRRDASATVDLSAPQPAARNTDQSTPATAASTATGRSQTTPESSTPPATSASPATAAPVPLSQLEPLDPAQWSSAMAQAEIALLRDLSAGEWSATPERTLHRLKPFLEHSDPAVRDAARDLHSSLAEGLDAVARQSARDLADRVEALAENENYLDALQQLADGTAALKSPSPYLQERGLPLLNELKIGLEQRRVAANEKLVQSTTDLDDLRALEKHKDPQVRDAAAKRVKELLAAAEQAQRRRELTLATGRDATIRLFDKYRTAVLDADFDAAQRAMREEMRNVAGPGAWQGSLLRELMWIRQLFATVHQLSVDTPRPVELPLRRGSVSGMLLSIHDKQLDIRIAGGAVVSIKPESLSAAGLAQLLGPKRMQDPQLSAAVWALAAWENPDNAKAVLEKNYAQINQPLPEHWDTYFKLSAYRDLSAHVGKDIETLHSALRGENIDRARELLAALEPRIKTLREYGPLPNQIESVLKDAAGNIGAVQSRRIVLQNGVQPTAKYDGLVTDQISQYSDAQRKTDVGIQNGLKLGASGGLQRGLLKFDGLELHIGQARVKKATLELFQIDSPKSAGANLALYRLKQPWEPDHGSWRSFGAAATGADWSVPGATGRDDIAEHPDAECKLDAQQNVWRAFDVTLYVQDVLNGKWQNNGFLLRLSTDEPTYHVRIHPDVDIAGNRDATRRPRLTLDLEF